MALITINDLVLENSPVDTDMVAIDGAAMRKTTIANLAAAGRPFASQVEAEAGADNTKTMTPLRTKQAVESYGLTKAGNLDGLTNAATARTNLGLGTAALSDATAFLSSGANSVSQVNMQDNSVGTPEIIDGSVTETKLAAGVFDRSGVEYASLAALQAATIPSGISSVYVRERVAARGGGARWRVTGATEPNVPSLAKAQDAAGKWVMLDPDGDTFALEMLGAFPRVIVEAETLAWYNACATKPTYLHLMHTDRLIRRLKWRGVWSKLTGLWCFAGHTQADGVINIKNPGTFNATYGGGLTFAAGYGVTGDGTTGFIALAPWNSLVTQNDGAILLYSMPNAQTPATGYAVASLTTGSGGGMGIIPRDGSGNLLTRFMSTSSQFAAYPYRGGVIVASRSASGSYTVFTEGEVFQTPAVVSAAVTTDTASLLRANTQYNNDTIRAFATTNDGLTEFEADAFSYFMRMYVDELSGVINEGPTAASVGFSVVTSDTAMSLAFTAASSFSAVTGRQLEVGFGTYESSTRFPAVRGAKVRGVHRQGSCFRLSSTAPQGEPVVAPPHNNGGETLFSVENITLDGAYVVRGHSGFGPNRPGASGFNTCGGSLFSARSIDTLDTGLHGVDMSNTGEWNGTQWQYVVTPMANKRLSGVPSTDCQFFDIQVENQGDDAVTTHYSYGFEVDGVRALYARDQGITSMGFEADDGSYNGIVRNIYSRGNAFGAASKSHTDNPAPSNVTFENITLECGFGRAFWATGDTSGNPDFGTNIHVDGVTYLRPFEVAGSEAIGVHITSSVRNISVKNIKLKAKASDTSFLYRALYVSGAASEVLIDGFSIENWAVQDDAGVHGNGDTIRVTSGCTDVTMRNGKAVGCGKFGLWDSGSTRADYDAITVQGTGVASSIGVWISASIATNNTTHRALKVISGFTTPITIVP